MFGDVLGTESAASDPRLAQTKQAVSCPGSLHAYAMVRHCTAVGKMWLVVASARLAGAMQSVLCTC